MNKELQKLLQEDILNRYDNEEYWDPDIVENYEHDSKVMKNYRVTCDIVSGTLSAVVRAKTTDGAQKIFNELDVQKFTEEPDRRLENYEFEEITD